MVETSIELDTVLDVCEHRHRRIVLVALANRQQPVSINDLTEAIVEHDYHVSLTEASETNIQTGLHHVHLPKLADAGLVEYDFERQLAESTARIDREVPHLSAILDIDPELATPLNA